jgi:hypothetical protein
MRVSPLHGSGVNVAILVLSGRDTSHEPVPLPGQLDIRRERLVYIRYNELYVRGYFLRRLADNHLSLELTGRVQVSSHGYRMVGRSDRYRGSDVF